MQNIYSYEELLEIEKLNKAIIFIEAEWSAYAMEAKKMMEMQEKLIGCSDCFYSIDLDKDKNVVGIWLKKKNNKIFPNCATGAGSVILMENGEIKQFIHSINGVSKSRLEIKFKEFIYDI